MNTINHRPAILRKTDARITGNTTTNPSKRTVSAALALSAARRTNPDLYEQDYKILMYASTSSNSKSKFDLRSYTDVVILNNNGVQALERHDYQQALTQFRKAYDNVYKLTLSDTKKQSKQSPNKRRKISKNVAEVVKNDVDHTKENNLNQLVHTKDLHSFDRNTLDYFIDMRKKRRYHFHFETANDMFGRRFRDGFTRSEMSSESVINNNDAINKHGNQLFHTSYITDVEKEFHLFNQGLCINQPGINDPSVVLPSSIEELNKLLSLLLYNIGKVFQQSNQLEDALEIYRKSISLLPASLDDDDDVKINSTTTKLALLHSMGQIHFTTSNTDESIEIYSTALDVINNKLDHQEQNEKSFMSLLSATTKNCIMIVKIYQQFMVNPDDVLSSTLLSNEKESNDLDLLTKYKRIALFYTNLAICNYFKGEYKLATVNFLSALNIQSSTFGSDSLDAAILLFYLGQVYYKRNELDQAIQYFVKYFDIAKNHKVQDATTINLDIASVCCYLGKAFHKKKQLEYALIYYEAALDIHRKTFGQFSLQAAGILNKIGFIYYDNHLLDLSLKCCKMQWNIEKKAYMNDDSSTTEQNYRNAIITLLNIADIHLKKYQYASALEFYRKVVGLQKKIYSDKDHPEIIQSMNRIGYVMYLKGDYTKCFKIFQDSLRTLFHHKRNHPFDAILKTFPKQTPSPIATKTMYDIAKTLFTIGDLETALTCFNLSLNMNLTLLSQDKRTREEENANSTSLLSYAAIDQFDVLLTLYDVACIHHHKGDVNTALETLTTLTSIYNKHDKTNKKDNVIILIRALSILANIYLFNNNDEFKKKKMMECYTKAVRLCRRYNISEFDESILLPLNVQIYAMDIDYPLAAPVA